MLLACFIIPSQIKLGQAITAYESISTDVDDGYLNNFNSDYDTAHGATIGYVIDTAAFSICGQRFYAVSYTIYRGALFFDTSSIPEGATIDNATLSIYVFDNQSDTDFNVTIQNAAVNKPLVTSDYYRSLFSGNGGSRNSSEISAYGYWNITLNSYGISWIDTTGYTVLGLRSNWEIDQTAPSGDEMIYFYTTEQGESYSPKLYVGYTTGEYRYIVHGPFYENGTNASVLVNVTLQIEDSPNEEYTLDGTDGNYDTLNIAIEHRGILFNWNISATEYNRTRNYYLTTDTFEEIWIYVPDPTQPAYMYTFTVNDFVGVSNAYLETIRNIGGNNRIIERYGLDVVNSVPFWMSFATRYDLRLVCDQGTYTWGGFVAGIETSQTLIIMTGMFPISYPGLNVTASASRRNSTWVQANYTDTQNLTSWVQVTIRHKSGTTWLTDYTTNSTGNTHQIDWLVATATTHYLVGVVALRNGTQQTWSISCPALPTTTNPWAGQLEGLGTWPIPASNVIGLVITLFVFGVFSYANLPVGCFLGVLTAGFLTYFGWLDLSWDLVALCFALVVFVGLGEAKKKEREI